MRVRRATVAAWVLSCAACSAKGDSPYFESVSPVSVLDTAPAAGEGGVSIDAVLEIEFSGEIDPQGVEDGFALETLAGAAVPVVVSYAAKIARVTLASGERLDLDTAYRASLEGLRDARGRPMPAYEWQFTTVNPPPATVVARLPAPGSTAPGNFVVRAVFSVPIDASLLGANPIRVNAGAVGGSSAYDAAGRTLTFRPNAPADGPISVVIDPVFDVYGRQLTLTSGWSFSAAIATVDAERPTLPGAVTAAETSAGTITVTFDPAADDQWSGDSVRYEALLTRLKPPAPTGCLDPFEPEAHRAAVYGTSAGISVSGLSGGTWLVILEAEDGSGRRSLPHPADAPVTLSQAAPTFTTAIEPLLTERCALSGCHAGANPPGFVDYTGTRDEIVSHQSQHDEMPLVTPFCLERSYIWRKLNPGYEIEGQLMPPDIVSASSLSRRERELFRGWIQDLGGN